jgi:5-formyltetrahydrofolate cyclo-ligase
MFFAPQQVEIDVWPLLDHALASGKTVVLPRFDSASKLYVGCQIKDLAKDLAPGRFGIREPISSCCIFPLNRLDFVLVPGVAFDLHGRRLGRGRGYYDQILTAVRGTTCGVAFDEQVVREVPVGPDDVSVNCLLTPTRWVEL